MRERDAKNSVRKKHATSSDARVRDALRALVRDVDLCELAGALRGVATLTGCGDASDDGGPANLTVANDVALPDHALTHKQVQWIKSKWQKNSNQIGLCRDPPAALKEKPR